MTLPKARKILLILGLVLLLVQLPWFFVVQHMVNTSEVKTTATVIRIESSGSNCTETTNLCDHSPREYPVYAFYDTAGHRQQQDDRYFGEYKQHNPLRALFWKNVGDKVTAYYPKDRPDQVLFMAGPLAYSAWLIPLYIAIPVFFAAGVLYVIQKLRR